MARLAMAGNGSLKDAGRRCSRSKRAIRETTTFSRPAKSWAICSWPTKVRKAEPFYAKLAAAPWPDYQHQAAVLTGRTLEAQKQYDKAIKKYEEAETMDGEGKEVEGQKLTAQPGQGHLARRQPAKRTRPSSWFST